MISKPAVLIVLDGWGLAKPGKGNAVSLAKIPNFKELWSSYPHTQLMAGGEAIGLPSGEMGSSEFGHLIIGAGRIVYQDFSRISLAISDGSFFKNQAFLSACQKAKSSHSHLHLLGLLSYGSIHADKDHLYSLLKLTKEQNLSPDQIKLHLFTDGRDSPPKSALSLVSELQKVIKEIGVGEIISITGRYYAMDRDRRWDRTEKAYNALVLNQSEKAKTPEQAIENYYQRNITDEFIPPTVFSDQKIEEGDVVIFFNFRTDRARQLTQAFTDPRFYAFNRQVFIKDLFFVTMTEFEKNLPVSAVAFPPIKVNATLPKVLSDRGLRQLHIAETEKYAFVTYYFNGLYEKPVLGEDRILIPSPQVATYDLKPAMSAYEITQIVVNKIPLKIYDFILINFANTDMVGHTGVLSAGIKACEVVDECLGKIVKSVFTQDGVCFIVADHGSVEEMIDTKTGEKRTQHSLNPVPFIAVGKKWQWQPQTLPQGNLSDVAPTILTLLGIPIPDGMTGRPLIT